MATSVYPATGGFAGNTETQTSGNAAVFVPELYEDEVIKWFEATLVMGSLVNQKNMEGVKGNTIYFPKTSQAFSATTKTENTAVTIQNKLPERVTLTIDQHKEVSRLLEDHTNVQAFNSFMEDYTRDAGYAIAKDIDDALFALGKSLGDGDGSDWTHSRSFMFDGSGGLTAYDGNGSNNTAAFDDGGFRRAIQYLDDANIPQNDRVLVIPPVVRNTLMGIARFTEQSFVGEVGNNNTIRSGVIGNPYGIPVIVSSNCPTVDTTARACLLFHKDAFCLGTQMKVRMQEQYKQDFLGTLYTTDTLYGTCVRRTDAGLALIVSA